MFGPTKLSLSVNEKSNECDEIDGAMVSTVACKSPIVESELGPNEDSTESHETSHKLTLSSNRSDIIDAMKKEKEVIIRISRQR